MQPSWRTTSTRPKRYWEQTGLVRYSLMAGERALAAYAWEEAHAHFQRGLNARGIALTGTDPAPNAEAAALLFGYAGAQRAVQAALAIAQAERDSDLEMRILADAARVDRYNLRFDESLSKGQRALELALRFDDLRAQVAAESEITLALFLHR